ncbi:MAG: NAD(P)/FAD-dependent oxidoreductase [Nocardiopsaceae bacterium]|jgi:NADH dehydrogenase|nr:NAD(P)/FAD-dependent oxidoreductase [Nocardiopsaceae bacterium]
MADPADSAESTGEVRIVIAGAGFAGLTALSELARLRRRHRFPGGSRVRVTLVEQNSYSTFQPLLYQVATAGLTAADVAYPAWTAVRKAGARFRMGEITGLDTARRELLLRDGSVLDYDYLILATGISAAFFGVGGAAEHALSLYTRRDAIILRDRLIAELERRSAEGDTRDLNVTVVGGGATGVELAGTLAELRNIALPASFPEIDPASMHVRLIELGPALIAPFAEPLRNYARTELLKRGVEVRLRSEIAEVAKDHVRIADENGGGSGDASGEVLPSDVTVWAAGVAAPPWIGKLGLPAGRGGRLVAGPDLRVAGEDRVFAAGDIALIEGDPQPQLAQPAIQHGRHAATQVSRLAKGQPTQPFSYKDKGIMATIGRRSAVVELPIRIRARGTLAWLAWLGLHLITLLGGRNRISALVNLTWRYLTWSRGGGVIVGDDPFRDNEPGAGRRRMPGHP